MSKVNIKLDQEGNLTDIISEHYKKFFDKFVEIDTLPLDKWKNTHILAYICKRYESYYDIKYSFTFSDPAPSKSREVFEIKRLANMLSSQPVILKQYIDWVFDSKIIERKKRITSLRYLTHVDLVNEFKFKFLLGKTATVVRRTDNLPQNVAALCARHGFNILTYAELAFLKKMKDQERLFSELKALNFQVDILDKIA